MKIPAPLFRRPDLVLVLFAGSACFATALFVTSYYWHGQWVVYQEADHAFRLLSNHGGFAIQRIDPPNRDGISTVYPSVFGLSYSFVALLFFFLTAILLGRPFARNRSVKHP